MNKLLVSTLLTGLVLTGCAQTRGYTPAVDTRTSNPAATANLDRDIQECQALAEQAAGNTAAETGLGAITGGAIGAATGAIVGAVSGSKNIGKAAIIGATAGGVGGAAKQGFESNTKYQQAYKNCMAQRGHSVVQ